MPRAAPSRDAGEPIGELEGRIRAAVEAAPPSPRQALLRAAIAARLPGASRTTRRRLGAIALAALLSLGASGTIAAPLAIERIPPPLREAIVEILGDLGVVLPGPVADPTIPAVAGTPTAVPAERASIPPNVSLPTPVLTPLPTLPVDPPSAGPGVVPPTDGAPPPVPTDVPSVPNDVPAPPLPSSAPSIPPLP